MNTPAIWINLFSVPNNKHEEFLTWWADVRDIIASQPGFAGGQLYRSDKADARFNFINVARWENDLFAQDHGKKMLSMQSTLATLGVETTRELCSVFAEY